MALTISEQIILKNFGEFIVQKIKFDIRNKPVTTFGDVNSSGALADSIRYEVYDNGLRIYGLDYVQYLEFGRGPGKMPPEEDIVDWIHDKPITPSPTYVAKWTLKDGTQKSAVRNFKDLNAAEDSLVYLIRRKIANKGTTIFEQGGSDLISGILTSKLIADLQEQMSSVFIQEISSQFMQAFTGENVSASTA